MPFEEEEVIASKSNDSVTNHFTTEVIVTAQPNRTHECTRTDDRAVDLLQHSCSLSVDVVDGNSANDTSVTDLCEDFTTNVQLHQEKHQHRLDIEIDDSYRLRFICDLGYGLPNENRPRKEKILAIARQMINFLTWQQHQQRQLLLVPLARIYIVLGKSTASTNCDNQESILVQNALLERMHEVWNQHQSNVSSTSPVPFPDDIVTFIHVSLDEFLCTISCNYDQKLSNCDNVNTERMNRNSLDDVIYLSPDAVKTLDITAIPPKNIIIGLLIDRRTIQVNRSVARAQEINIPSMRWPLEKVTALSIHKNEPLNVDCVLEGMQQWYWNMFSSKQRDQQQLASAVGSTNESKSWNVMEQELDAVTITKAFENAAIQID
jgi:hypothetical protein